MTPLITEAIDPHRLISRLTHYAAAAGASKEACGEMMAMLQSPLGQAVLALSQQQLDSLLVNDMYKIRMQNMYSQYMTGVAAEFALKIRKIHGGEGSLDASTVLSSMRDHQPDLYSALMDRVCNQLQQLQPLDSRVVEVLREFHSGFTPPAALAARLAAQGVAPISWNDIEGQPVAIGAGPIEAASNTETSCMQAVQAAVIAAAAAATNTATSSCSSSGSKQQQAAAAAARPGLFMPDRTERLANSLGKMVATVEQINTIEHSFNILLMAGRRSTDIMHLLLQNLYFMQHVKGYVGTSSVLACVLLRQCMAGLGMGRRQRQQLVRGLLGTHAHELTSITQQLLVGYDEEAGRRTGLKVPVCISQLLAHLLFQVANGDQTPTALPDTFTTPYFVRLAMLCTPPAEFVADMQDKWGVHIEQGSRVFDLFRVWRMDSGDYPALAQVLFHSWQQRCTERQAAGLDPLPQPQLMHSNIDSVDDIRALVALPEQLRPNTLGFGGLADGFMPFDLPSSSSSTSSAAPAPATAVAPAGALAYSSRDHSADPVVGATNADTANRSSHNSTCSSFTLPIASLVMKAVQASVHDCSSRSSNQAATAAATATPEVEGITSTAAEPSEDAADKVYTLVTGNATAGAATMAAALGCNNQCQCSKLLGHLQECAVKLGDDASLSKAQVDPRLPFNTQQEVLCRLQAMVQGAGQLLPQHAGSLSEVLREAYVAVSRERVLNA